MAGWIQEQLPSMFALAHERSDASRLILAEKLAYCFMHEDADLTPREEILLGELITQMLKTQNPVFRQELVKKFGESKHMPRSLAQNLARESIDVAQDILTLNINLTDGDLVDIIKDQTQDHASAIAKRIEVSEMVADALVATGNIRVMQIVAENMGAQLSTKTMLILADCSRNVLRLQKAIVNRPELTPDMASKLYWWISQDLRRIALQRFGVGLGQLDVSLASVIEDKLGEHVFEKYDDSAMIKLAEWLEERAALNSKILPQILRLGHFRLFNIVLSRLSKLGLPLVDIIVSESGGRTLAALCRAINIDKANFVSIFLLSRGARSDDQVVHPRELSFAISAYDRLSPDSASDLLRTWRTDPDYLLRRAQDQITLEA